MNMIPPAGFDYAAELEVPDFPDGVVEIKTRLQDQTGAPSLVGTSPRLRIWGGLLEMVATDRESALIKRAFFPIGGAVSYLSRAGDSLRIVRGGKGQVALALTRADELVLALGAVSNVPLGTGLAVSLSRVAQPLDSSNVRVSWDNDIRELGTRESALVGGYDVYVESTRVPLEHDECVSIVGVEDPIAVNEARRSAVLLGTQQPDFREF